MVWFLNLNAFTAVRIERKEEKIEKKRILTARNPCPGQLRIWHLRVRNSCPLVYLSPPIKKDLLRHVAGPPFPPLTRTNGLHIRDARFKWRIVNYFAWLSTMTSETGFLHANKAAFFSCLVRQRLDVLHEKSVDRTKIQEVSHNASHIPFFPSSSLPFLHLSSFSFPHPPCQSELNLDLHEYRR